MKVIISGGGTAGHIYPGLALAGTLESIEEAPEILFVGTKNGLESKVVPEAKYNFKAIEVQGLSRKLSFGFIKTIILLFKGLFESLGIINDFKPDVVVGLGGYVSFPVVAASVIKKIPIVIHEQNVIPGLANKLLAKKAKAVAVSFPGSEKYFSNVKNVVLTGNPVRKELLRTREKNYEEFSLMESRKTVFIFGGSRGAQRINQAAIEVYPLLKDLDSLQIIHSTGIMNFNYVKEAIRKDQLESDKLIYRCYPYLDTINLAYSVSDLIICRAGATTLAEITALGKATILVPYPYATGNHQSKNAEILEDAGAAIVIEDEDLNGNTLYKAIQNTVFDDHRLTEMNKASRSLGCPDAAKKMAELVLEAAR